MIDTNEVARLREQHAAATAGEESPLDISHSRVILGVGEVNVITRNPAQFAAYIAAAHNALPDVLDALEQAWRERDEARAQVAKEQEFSGGYIGAGMTLVAERDNLRRELAAMRRERDALAAQLATAQQTVEWLHTVAEPEFDRRDSEFALLDMLGDMD